MIGALCAFDKFSPKVVKIVSFAAQIEVEVTLKISAQLQVEITISKTCQIYFAWKYESKCLKITQLCIFKKQIW